MDIFVIRELAQQAGQPSGTDSVWTMLGVVAAAGAVGGVVNALLSNNGFVIPKPSNGILQLGVIGNVLLGAFAAVITWGLPSH